MTALKLSDLSPATKDRIKSYRWDRIIEKHEGPETWSHLLDYVDFLEINGFTVLLPVGADRHPNITALRCIVSVDNRTLTLFLKDRTYSVPAQDEMFYNGFVAICDKFPGEEFYIAILYHEWFIIEN